MNWGMLAPPYISPQFGLPMEGLSSDAVNMDPKPILSLLQGSPILDEERMNSWPLTVPTYSRNLQVDAEAHTVGVYSSPQSTTRTVDEGTRTSYPESRIVGAHDFGFHTTCLSDPEFMCQTMSPRFTTSTLRVSEGSYSTTVISNEDHRHIDLIDGDKSRSWYQECMPIKTVLDHNHRTYITPTDGWHRDQRASREMPQGPKKPEEGPAMELPKSPLRSSWKRGAPPGRYRCPCGRDYAQPQGLARHRRETHEACICMYCGAFAWARPYRFREHLKSKHPGVDPDVALEEAAYLKNRCNVIKDLPQRASPFAVTRVYPSSSYPAAMEVPPVSLPAVSPVGYDSQPGFAESGVEPTMEIHKYEDARDLSESLGANYAHITFPPTKQRARVEKTAGRVGTTARE